MPRRTPSRVDGVDDGIETRETMDGTTTMATRGEGVDGDAVSRVETAYEEIQRRLVERRRRCAKTATVGWTRELDDDVDLTRDIPKWRAPREGVMGRTACGRAITAACAETGARVSARVVRQLEKKDADARYADLGTIGARVIARGVVENAVTESLDVSGNRIDDDGVAALCEAAGRSARLRALNFSENRLSSAVESTSAVRRVKVLNFTSCGVDDACAMALFATLIGDDCALESLNLSKNRVTDACGKILGDTLAKGGALRSLDLSWNSIGARACAHIARGLRGIGRLEYLSLAWNGIGDEGGKLIGDTLRTNRSLIELDLSRCRLGCDACMVISEGLRTNDTLTTLKLDHNACGEDGGRHLMMMLLQNDYLTTLTLEGSSFVDVLKRKRDSSLKKSVATFNPHNPDGHHALNLDDTGDRAIASQLWHQDRENPGSMKSAKLLSTGGVKKGLVSSDVLDNFRRDGLDSITSDGGVLEIQFASSAARVARRPQVIEVEDFDNILRQLRNNRLSDFERLCRLKMFCRSYYFHAEHAAKLLETFILAGDDRLQAASACYARLLDAENAERMFKSKTEFDKLKESIGSYMHFRATNPTGRYVLNLATGIDRVIASTLMDSATFEGCRRTWRNARLNAARVTDLLSSGVPESLMRSMPPVGTLEFDYTSNIRVLEKAEAMSNDQLHSFLRDKCVLTADANDWSIEEPIAALHALREASVYLNITSKQYERVCAVFAPGADRVEAGVILFTRVIDHANIPAFVVHRMSCYEQCVFGARLGWRNVLGDSLQAFTVHYRLDLNCDEQAGVAKQLVSSAVREFKEVQVIRNVTINGRRLARDPVEDDTLWSVLTAESFTPTLEFDYFGRDVWDVVRKELNVHVVPEEKPEREATLKRLATRLAFIRAATLHGFWIDPDAASADRSHRAVWRSAWVASLRQIVAAESQHGGQNPPLRVIFDLIDDDGSGSLSIDELSLGVGVLGCPIPRRLLARHALAIRPDHFADPRRRSDDVVDFDAFERVCADAVAAL